MQIHDEVVSGTVHKITLSGRMDIEGAGRIELPLAAMTASPRTAIVVDMAAVPFMCSMGIRVLLLTAKAVVKRGGRFALLAPDDNVRGVLSSAGIDQLIPVCDDLDQAISKVTG